MQALPLSLFALGPARVRAEPLFQRVQLDPCCWVDRVEGLVEGADGLFAEVAERFPWEHGQRLMYGKLLDEPRLTAELDPHCQTAPPVVGQFLDVLSAHYQRTFTGLFCNYYRSGADSVAWHRDRIGHQVVDPLVAIVSLGGPRTFALRDRGREAEPLRVVMRSGDALIMGGATQHHWEHAVPKTAHAPPRISLTTRAGWPNTGASGDRSG